MGKNKETKKPETTNSGQETESLSDSKNQFGLSKKELEEKYNSC